MHFIQNILEAISGYSIILNFLELLDEFVKILDMNTIKNFFIELFQIRNLGSGLEGILENIDHIFNLIKTPDTVLYLLNPFLSIDFLDDVYLSG